MEENETKTHFYASFIRGRFFFPFNKKLGEKNIQTYVCDELPVLQDIDDVGKSTHFLFWCNYGANAFFLLCKHEKCVEFFIFRPVLITGKKTNSA